MKIPLESIDTAMLAPCGMNCLVCYRHCYHRGSCAGCLNSDIGKPEHCRKCDIMGCVKGMGISYCFERSEYPCKRIMNLRKSYSRRYHTSLVENSNYVQQHGLEMFIKSQKEKFTYLKCGGVILMHDRECSECHESVK